MEGNKELCFLVTWIQRLSKWLRNSLEAAVEVRVKGNEVNLSNGSLLTARRNIPIP